ncbi:MAG TPA: S41 family peptidase [Actinomycetota bacterium]|jgi:C-terminal processing protease CtpA/Prc|nr:S41 family peptidase [Actinomycetota bacterium]
MSSTPKIGLDPEHGLGDVRTLPQWRTLIEQDRLTPAERATLLQQAAILLDGLYVHLLHKHAMYAVDPSQRLRLLRFQQAQMSDAQLHAELLRIFDELRDLHTNYVLPDPYRGPVTFLGILLEQYWVGLDPHWMVSKVFSHLTGDDHLVPGVEVTHWNGSPIALAVARNAEREAGSNQAARLARGLENMTLRDLSLSPTPDEDWVDLEYRAAGSDREARISWRVYNSIDELTSAITHGGAGAPPAIAGVAVPASHLIGLDLRTELAREAKKRLFAPAAVEEERRVARARAAGDVLPPTEEQIAADAIPTMRPQELSARTVTTTNGTFGHLRIRSFHIRKDPGAPPEAPAPIGEFLEEVERLLRLLPKEGLILDVRGNGGGHLIAAEFLLQFLTPRQVLPEPFQFINTPTTAELCAQVADMGAWSASINASIQTGAQYSSAMPLYGEKSETIVNSVGQLYHGPVVLVTDALCYSATDSFAAGFQDNEIGPVLGVDDNTGAGGANVVEHADLLEDWHGGPLKKLPGGARLRVALRRSLRVGKRWGGQPVEDLGVIPDVRHRLTSRDLLEGNADLMEKAGELLARVAVRTLDVDVASLEGSTATLQVTTGALRSLDVYVNARPVRTLQVHDGKHTITVPLGDAMEVSVRLEGFDDGHLAAARTLRFTSSGH